MSRRIHKAKPSDGLPLPLSEATTSTGKGEEKKKKKKKYGLLHRLWAREEEEEEEEERDLLHQLWAREEEELDLLHPLWLREEEEEVPDLFRLWEREGEEGGGQGREVRPAAEMPEPVIQTLDGLSYRGVPARRIRMQLSEIQEVDSNSVSSFDYNNLEVVSETPPVEQEVEREETSAAPNPTGGQNSAINEELKQATKFSYFATTLAVGVIVSLLIFHLENKSGEPHTLFFKALIFFVLATFASGLSIILLTICAPAASYQMPIIRGLVYTTLVFLALTSIAVPITLMKAMGELAFVPTIVVVLVVCIIVYYKKTMKSD